MARPALLACLLWLVLGLAGASGRWVAVPAGPGAGGSAILARRAAGGSTPPPLAARLLPCNALHECILAAGPEHLFAKRETRLPAAPACHARRA